MLLLAPFKELSRKAVQCTEVFTDKISLFILYTLFVLCTECKVKINVCSPDRFKQLPFL